jgi:hypothetical protein
MSRNVALPLHRRWTVDDFLAFAGWELTPGMSRAAIGIALNFYQDKVPRPLLLRRVERPGPWSLPRGNVVKLSEWMQAIDYRRPVARVVARANERFLSYRSRRESEAKRVFGNWFANLSARQERLALPADQDLVRIYVVKTPVECLKSAVSDAFTWLRADPVEIQEETFSDKYFTGGGCQYFIWEPERYLERL